MKRFRGYGLVVMAALSLAPPCPAESPADFTARPVPYGVQRSPHAAPQSYLGIDVRDVGDDQVSALKLKDTKGAEIIRVDHDAPAGKMGLRLHDVVLQMNGVLIEGEEQLRHMLHDTPPGKPVALTINRDGQLLSVSSTMADRNEIEREVWEQHLGAAAGLPGPQAPPAAFPTGDATAAGPAAASPATSSHYSKSFLGTLLTSPTYTGMMLELMSPQLAQFFGVATGSGLLVRSVADRSPAAVAGLQAGDVVLRANFQSVGSMNHWLKIVREAKGKPISVVVLRDRLEKTLVITPDVKHRSSLEELFPATGSALRACL